MRVTAGAHILAKVKKTWIDSNGVGNSSAFRLHNQS